MKKTLLNGAKNSNNQKGKYQPQNGQSEKPLFGTKEWAKTNVNCVSGCNNDCCYCYSKSMAIRFKRKTPDTWKNEEVDTNKVEKDYRKRDGVVMFPSSHDISPNTVDACLVVLKKLLKAKNDVLVVTKPHLEVIKALCADLVEYQQQIVFRFTIGSSESDVLRFWEPGAPSYEERVASVMYASLKGFKTSLSIEPCLDLRPDYVIDRVGQYITNDVWIGLPNMLYERLSINGANDAETLRKAKEIKKGQSREWMRSLVEKYSDNPAIMWKDSIKKEISKNK